MFVEFIWKMHIVLCSNNLQWAAPTSLEYSLNEFAQLEFGESDLEQL